MAFRFIRLFLRGVRVHHRAKRWAVHRRIGLHPKQQSDGSRNQSKN
jgi:hypothetical protein